MTLFEITDKFMQTIYKYPEYNNEIIRHRYDKHKCNTNKYQSIRDVIYMCMNLCADCLSKSRDISVYKIIRSAIIIVSGGGDLLRHSGSSKIQLIDSNSSCMKLVDSDSDSSCMKLVDSDSNSSCMKLVDSDRLQFATVGDLSELIVYDRYVSIRTVNFTKDKIDIDVKDYTYVDFCDKIINYGMTTNKWQWIGAIVSVAFGR